MQRLIALIALGVVVTLSAATAGCARRAVAKVNGEAITERELHDQLEAYAGQATLDRMVLDKLLRQRAKQKGIEVSDAETSQVEQSMRKPFGERWGEYLRMRGQTEEDFQRDIRDRLLIAKVAVPEKEVKEYWEQNRTRFDVPATARYRRIILRSKQEADKARQAIIGGKLSFAQALQTMSVPQDLLAKQGGEIGPVALGYGDPDLEKALSTLPPRQLSEPIAATFPQGAYELVEVLTRTSGKKVSFAQARGSVLMELTMVRQQQVGDFVRQLRSEASITIFPQRYKGLAEQYAQLKERAPPKIEAPNEKPRPAPHKPAAQPQKPAAASGKPTGDTGKAPR